MAVQTTDLLVVERDGIAYPITVGGVVSGVSPLLDTDLLLVERDGEHYQVTVAEVSDRCQYITPLRA
jgi:hypothetical protein